MPLCPCGTGKTYRHCCGLFIDDNYLPKTPEELMRSRYTAYTRANMTYISNTMKMPASKNFDADAAYQWAVSVVWRKLDVLHAVTHKKKGLVEFIAYYDEQGVEKNIHEKSEFHQVNGKWYYVDGKIYSSKPTYRRSD